MRRVYPISKCRARVSRVRYAAMHRPRSKKGKPHHAMPYIIFFLFSFPTLFSCTHYPSRLLLHIHRPLALILSLPLDRKALHSTNHSHNGTTIPC